MIIYSNLQYAHQPRSEWSFGRAVPYPEKPGRIRRILASLRKRGYEKQFVEAKSFALANILRVHDRRMVQHIKSCASLPAGEKVYAHIFPYRHLEVAPQTDLKRAGFYCFDVGTQIDRHTFSAAKSAVDVALHGTQLILKGKSKRVFALCRPPGHHADRAMYGGYCYFNNAAIAAYFLSQRGRVVILDLDFHHGNGTQYLFYNLPNISFISIHGDPARHYPYFCGFRHERGDGMGVGHNWNLPLPDGVDDAEYAVVLKKVLKRIRSYRPAGLIVSMGFDTFIDDPLGTFALSRDFYHRIGQQIAALDLPTLACLEGGYDVGDLGENATNFYEGLMQRG